MCLSNRDFFILTYEEHWNNNAARHIGARCPAGHQKVYHEHGRQAHITELLMRVLRVEMVHRLLPRPVEQRRQLAKRAVQLDVDRAVRDVIGDGVLGVQAGVELQVDLCVGDGGVCRYADVLVLVVWVRALRVHAGHRGAT